MPRFAFDAVFMNHTQHTRRDNRRSLMSARLNRRSANVLQRGSACLACRKRKLKCDSSKPVCQPCTRMNRASECIYDEKPKSRNQALREKLSLLEEHVRFLESYPPDMSPPPSSWRDATIFPPASPVSDDYTDDISFSLLTKSRWSRRSSQTSDTIDSAKSVKLRPETSMIWHTEESPYYPLNLTPFSSWNLPQESSILPEPVTRSFLLERFLECREHCWFYSDVQRLQLQSHTTTDDGPHPALLNAVYLLACHFERSSFCSKLEPLFLARAMHQITAALDCKDRLVDIVQASCLVAIYFYLNYQISEGYRQAFSAVRLAIALGLHQINLSAIPAHIWGDPKEQGQKIHAFWQTYMVDRYWSAVYNLQTALPEFYSVCERITTPLPETAETLDSILSLRERHSHVALRQQPNIPQSSQLSSSTLKILAAGLFEKTRRLSNNISEEDNAYWAECRAAEFDVQWFFTVLPKYTQRETWGSQSSIFDVDLFTLWTLIHVSNMHLQQALKLTAGMLQSGFSVLAMVRQLEQDDYQLLDPIICACWYHVAKTLASILADTATGPEMPSEMGKSVHDIEKGLFSLNSALQEFAKYCPLSASLAAKCEDAIKIMGGI